MAYSELTINGYLKLANYWLNYYMELPIDNLHVSISSGNDKIGHAWNVSLLPILTCPNCGECMKLCYDIRDCIRYGKSEKNNVIRARAKNTAILLRDREKFFSEINTFMDRYNGKYKMFRYHVGGELKDMDYFREMNNSAVNHPDWQVWSYTKNYKAVNKFCETFGLDAIAKNLSMMFSEWRGMEMVNPFDFPEFRVVFKGEVIPENVWICPGNCDICKTAKRGCIYHETVYAKEH